jgi:hypothetical protein
LAERLGWHYIAALAMISIGALAFLHIYAIFVVIPCLVVGLLMLAAIGLMRLRYVAGVLLLMVIPLTLGGAMIYADLRYSLSPFLQQGLLRDIVGFVDQHVFQHFVLVVGGGHIVLALAALVSLRCRQPEARAQWIQTGVPTRAHR